MNDADVAVLKETVIRECAGLAVMMLVLWYIGPGKDLIAGVRHQVKMRMGAHGSRIDAEVSRFANQVSRWDHEQATSQDRRPAKDGGCGCG
jgi:hypothetical protein